MFFLRANAVSKEGKSIFREGGGGGGGRPLAPPRFPPLALGLCIYFRKRLLMGLYSLVHICLRHACDCIIMLLLAAEIPAKFNSSQLSRPTADVTVALQAIGEQMFT